MAWRADGHNVRQISWRPTLPAAQQFVQVHRWPFLAPLAQRVQLEQFPAQLRSETVYTGLLRRPSPKWRAFHHGPLHVDTYGQ